MRGPINDFETKTEDAIIIGANRTSHVVVVHTEIEFFILLAIIDILIPIDIGPIIMTIF